MSLEIYLVKWVDAESIDEWTSQSDIDHDLPMIESVGFLVKKTKALVTLALNYDTANDSFSCIMKIPTGMIQKEIKIGGKIESVNSSLSNSANPNRTKRDRRIKR